MVKPNESSGRPIQASGGIVVHPTPEGPQVLLAHCPRYDDWTFPKGKNESGEDPTDAALREVKEETGQYPRLVSRLNDTAYPVNGTSKRVRWYGMRVNQPRPFTPNHEVDEIRWMEPEAAGGLLSYDDDRRLLESVDIDALLATGTLFLVRHGAAGDRNAWSGDDRLRPISTKGERQAGGLVKSLADRQIEAILTSPFLRCIQTVEALAAATGLDIVEHPALAEGEGGRATRELVRELGGTNAVLCSHDDEIPSLLDWMVRKGAHLKSEFESRKGSIWAIEVEGGEFGKARYIPPIEE